MALVRVLGRIALVRIEIKALVERVVWAMAMVITWAMETLEIITLVVKVATTGAKVITKVVTIKEVTVNGGTAF